MKRTNVMTQFLGRGLLIALIIGLLVATLPMFSVTLAQDPHPKPTKASTSAASQPNTRIISGNPITIHIGSNASIQVYYTGYSHGQVYGDADSGIFFWVNGDLYGSNLNGTNDWSAAMYTLDLNTISHTGPTGSGTDSAPWVITTVADIGSTELRVTQEVSYVNGREYFDLEWTIENNSLSQISFDFFHAADWYFADSDYGYGYYDPSSGTVGGYNQAQDWYMSFIPATPATHYQEAHFSTIWYVIGWCQTPGSCSLGPGFNDTIDTSYIDNGAGLQWHETLDPGVSTSIGDRWTFGSAPPLSVDLAITSADSPDPVTVGNNLTYTVTVTNNGSVGATGVVLTDTLPESVDFVSVTPGPPTCTEGCTVTCNLGDLASGVNATVTIVVTPTTEGTITNTASVTGNETDPDPTNNTDTEGTSVVAQPQPPPAPEPTEKPSPAAAPEASTLLLLGSGLASLAGYAGLRLRARGLGQRRFD